MIEVRGEVVPVIQPVEMVEICFMNERVSPTDQTNNNAISGTTSEIHNCQKVYSHGVHQSAEHEESSSTDRCESYRLRVHKDIDVSDYSGEHASRRHFLTTLPVFHANDADTRHSIDNWKYFPMRAKSEEYGGPIPPPSQGAEECEEHQERENGLRGPSGGDADHNGV